MARNPRLLLVLVLLVTGSSCTATRTREFTREVYEPAGEVLAASRVFEAGLGRVRAALIGELSRRGAAFEENEPGRLLATLPWTHAGETAASVDLGRVRLVVARTERAYRSWSPGDFRCDSCIVRNGSLISQNTERVEDRVWRLDPDRYRVEASVRARLEGMGGRTRVELRLELAVGPPVPVGVIGRSTGRLENRLFDAIESALLR